jgi:hypothetical protein
MREAIIAAVPQNPVSPVAVVGGAMIAQVSLIGIMLIGGLFIRRSDRVARLWNRSTLAIFSWLILALAVTTLGILGTTDAFSSVWVPLFGEGNLPALFGWSSALRITIVLDILAVTVLVLGTGGAKNSPFQPLYFLIPTLAIFLREPKAWIATYVVLASLAFSVSLANRPVHQQDEQGRWLVAYWFVTISSFVLAAYIGVVTRPS